MKKIFMTAAIALTTLTVATKANAQQGFNFGVRAIPQTNWMLNSDDNDDPNYKRETTYGAAFGVGAGYNFTKNMGINLDVLYSMQGQTSTNEGIETKQRVDYVKIPLMFTYNTGIDSNHKVAFIGKLGPQLGIRTSSKFLNADGDAIIDDANDFYKSTTFGAVAGAGARFALAKNLTLDAGVRFDYDFTDAEDKDFVLYAKDRAATNNMTLGVELGLNYHIK
ncbi:MAG: PorT family protein [Sphingobacteriales bacterium]|nr:MAG: PorT family protein [Sphingobacteriales bacterium]